MALGKATYSVKLQGNIIQTKLCGSFSVSITKQYCDEVRRLIEQFDGEPFAMLVDDLQLDGGTPAAYEILDQHNAWVNQQNIIAKALIVDNAVKKGIILQRLPNLRKQNIAFFQDPGAGLAWLETQI